MAMIERETCIQVVTGQKRVGKTYTTRNEILNNYIKDTPKKKGQPVIIFDTNGEYTDVKSIKFDIDQYLPTENKKSKKVRDWKSIATHVRQYCIDCYNGVSKSEIRRVVACRKDGTAMTLDEKMESACILLENTRGSLLLLEDVNNYTTGTTSIDVISAITTNAHKGQDIIVHYQSMSALSPRIIQNATLYRMHKQADSVKRIEKKLDDFQLFQICEFMVTSEFKSGNIRFYVYVLPQESKIQFNNTVSREDAIRIFEKGCIDYLNKNPKVFQDFCTGRVDKPNKMSIDEKTQMQKEFIKEHQYYVKKNI